MKTFFLLLSLSLVLSACSSSPEVVVQDSGDAAELESMMDAPVDEAVVDGYPYENTDYGFSLNFPESMKNFVVTPRSEQVSYGNDEEFFAVSVVNAVSLASYDIGFEGAMLDGELQSFINVSVFKIADWDALMAEKARAPFLVDSSEVGRNDEYVFTMSHGQDVFPDGIQGSDYEVLEASFKVL